eukprot:4116526-Lingulodinium_polyedra.AAC.1
MLAGVDTGSGTTCYRPKVTSLASCSYTSSARLLATLPTRLSPQCCAATGLAARTRPDGVLPALPPVFGPCL